MHTTEMFPPKCLLKSKWYLLKMLPTPILKQYINSKSKQRTVFNSFEDS